MSTVGSALAEPEVGSVAQTPADARRSATLRGLLAPLALLVTIALLIGAIGSSSLVYDIDLALIAAIAAVGLNLLTGYAGLVSVGNAAFLGIGGYTVVAIGGTVPFPLPVFAAGAIAAAVGLVIGLPSLRLRGLYLIFSTLALQFLAAFAFEQYDSSTGAISGHFIPAPRLGPLNFADERTWLYVLLVLVAIVCGFARGVVRGKPGRAWAALRANEAAAAVIGVDVTRQKLLAFTTSSCLVGIAGAVGAYFLQEVSSSYYSLDLAVSYIAMILIGGLASIWGSLVGALVVTMIPFLMQDLSSALAGGGGAGFLQRNLSAIDTALYGLSILAFLFFRPAGIASLATPVKRLVQGWRRRA